jgi:hypothetical protein
MDLLSSLFCDGNVRGFLRQYCNIPQDCLVLDIDVLPVDVFEDLESYIKMLEVLREPSNYTAFFAKITEERLSPFAWKVCCDEAAFFALRGVDVTKFLLPHLFDGDRHLPVGFFPKTDWKTVLPRCWRYASSSSLSVSRLLSFVMMTGCRKEFEETLPDIDDELLETFEIYRFEDPNLRKRFRQI